MSSSVGRVGGCGRDVGDHVGVLYVVAGATEAGLLGTWGSELLEPNSMACDVMGVYGHRTAYFCKYWLLPAVLFC